MPGWSSTRSTCIQAARGQGVGRQLLAALITSTEAAGIWTIQSGIFPENTASVALHHVAGFRTVGRRERIGQHHGRWRDVLLLERRSPSSEPRAGRRGPDAAPAGRRPGSQDGWRRDRCGTTAASTVPQANSTGGR